MDIVSFQTPYMRSMTYIVSENRHAILIDPCKMPQVENDLVKKSLTIDMALLTHEHYDHISGIN